MPSRAIMRRERRRLVDESIELITAGMPAIMPIHWGEMLVAAIEACLSDAKAFRHYKITSPFISRLAFVSYHEGDDMLPCLLSNEREHARGRLIFHISIDEDDS